LTSVAGVPIFIGRLLGENRLLLDDSPTRKNADPPKRTGASFAQGSFKVIGPPTSGARACLHVERWLAYTRHRVWTQSGSDEIAKNERRVVNWAIGRFGNWAIWSERVC
jgi:hypothetical protein